MSIVRIGTTKKFSDGWDAIFGRKKAAAKKSAAKKKSTKQAKARKRK